jgi:hypothetical protein
VIPGNQEVIFTRGGKSCLYQIGPDIYCTGDLAAAKEEVDEFLELVKGKTINYLRNVGAMLIWIIMLALIIWGRG